MGFLGIKQNRGRRTIGASSGGRHPFLGAVSGDMVAQVPEPRVSRQREANVHPALATAPTGVVQRTIILSPVLAEELFYRRFLRRNHSNGRIHSLRELILLTAEK